MRTNAGYIITHSCVIDSNREIVLGCNANGYMTWICDNGDIYYCGRYFDNYKEALLNFGKRISYEAESLNDED